MRRMFGQWMYFFVTLTALFVVGCGDSAVTTEATGSGAGSSSSEGGSDSKDVKKELPTLTYSSPTVQITEPETGSEVAIGSDFIVGISLTYFTLKEPKNENVKNEGHFGVYLDDLSDTYIAKSYGKKILVNCPNVSVGKHSLTVVLLNHDGTVVEGTPKDTVSLNVLPYAGEGAGPSLELLEPLDQTVVSPGETLTVRVSGQNVEWVDPAEVLETDIQDTTLKGHYRVYLGYDEGDDFLAATVAPEVAVQLPETLYPGQYQLRVELWDAGGQKVEKIQPEGGQSVTLIVPGLKKPGVSIQSPADGALLIPGVALALDLDVSKFELVPPGGLPGGEIDVVDGHVRVYLDDATGDEYLVAEASIAPKVVIPEDLKAGEHTVHVVLVDTDGEPVGASDSVTLTAPGFKVVAPGEDAWFEYGVPGEVAVEVSNFELLEPGEDTLPEAGKGHYRVYLDDEDGDNYLLSTSQTSAEIVMDETVSPGKHDLRFSLREKNGAPVGFERTVSVLVGSGPPKIQALSPYAGQAVHPGAAVVFALSVQNFSLTAYEPEKENVYGQGHYRVFMDKASGDNYLYAGEALTSLIQLPSETTLGPHTFTLGLYNNDGSPLGVENEIWLDIVSPSSPVVQVISPEAGTAFAQGSRVNLETEVGGIELVPENGVNQTGQGHLVVRVKDTGEVLYEGEENPAEVLIPSDMETGLRELEVQLVSNTGSSYPNAKSSAWVTVWEMPEVSVVEGSEPGLIELGDTVNFEIAVSGAELVSPEEGLENKTGQVHYAVYKDGILLLKGGDAEVSATLPPGMVSGSYTLDVQFLNNDGTEIEGLVLNVPFDYALPTVEITAPDGLTEVFAASGTLSYSVEIGFFDLIPPAPGLANIQGEGHYLVYLDGGTGANFLHESHESAGEFPLPDGLAAGEHTLRVVLVNNVNTAIGIVAETDFLVADSGLAIVSPEKGVEVVSGQSLALELAVDNFTFASPGSTAENAEFEGHFGVYLDGDIELLVDATNDPTVVLPEALEIGDHMLSVRLLNHDGSAVEPSCEAKLPIQVVDAP